MKVVGQIVAGKGADSTIDFVDYGLAPQLTAGAGGSPAEASLYPERVGWQPAPQRPERNME
jgi:hypothetical protein